MTSKMMPVADEPETMWTLTDRGTVRLMLPPLPIGGLPKPISIDLDFDAESVDAMIGRLTMLRAQMLPKPARH